MSSTRHKYILTLIVSFYLCLPNIFASDVSEQIPVRVTSLSREPTISLTQALELAQRYIASEKIDLSRHYLDSVSFEWTKQGPKWFVRWQLKEPSDGGGIVIIVNMDKSIMKIGTR